MKKWILICAMLGAAAQTHAVVGSWSKQTAHYPIYFNDGYAEMPFNAPTSMPTPGPPHSECIADKRHKWMFAPAANLLFTIRLCPSPT